MEPEEKTHTSPTSQVTFGLAYKCGSCVHRTCIHTVSGIGHSLIYAWISQNYMDPMNEYNALNEAKQMIAIADENQNHHLEPEEILKYSEFFTGSKLMDYARNVHEEF